jgi:hypothetical protein
MVHRQQLTGYDVDVPTNRLALHMAVMGARMLGWPAEPLLNSEGGQCTQRAGRCGPHTLVTIRDGAPVIRKS